MPEFLATVVFGLTILTFSWLDAVRFEVHLHHRIAFHGLGASQSFLWIAPILPFISGGPTGRTGTSYAWATIAIADDVVVVRPDG
jgi:hypothetical protein